jgi:hypothetical protein
MSVPCTISEAIKIFKERRGQDVSNSASRSPVDILAVAVRYSILQSPSAPSSSTSPKAEIWITDPSISPSLNVRVTLSGSSAIARVVEEQVATGDIVRFNRLSLRYSDDDSFQFVHSWKDPEPGFEWYRLGHVDRSGRFTDKDATRSVPEDMITSSHRINEIINWCKQQKNGDLDSGLSPLQCQRRSLNEIQPSVGLLSNVVVRIIDYDCQRSPLSPAVGSRKRRRSSPGQTMTGFATLSDGSGTVMPFVDHGSRFASSLRTAKETGKVLMLTNLTSKIGRDIQERALPSDEIVLVPTRNTAALLLSNEDLLNYDDHAMTQSHTETQIPTSPQNHATIVSGIRDIMINGASIKDGKSLKSLPSFLATFVSPEGNYQEAVIHLCEKALDSDSGISSGAVHADAQVVKTLCGGIEASEIAKSEPLGRHVLELVGALLTEEISLRWTIKGQDRDERYAHVGKVVLPKL